MKNSKTEIGMATVGFVLVMVGLALINPAAVIVALGLVLMVLGLS